MKINYMVNSFQNLIDVMINNCICHKYSHLYINKKNPYIKIKLFVRHSQVQNLN